MKKISGFNGISNFWALAIVFMIVKLGLHFLTCNNYELHRDEMLYFNMADHLSAGYATVPPVIAGGVTIEKYLRGKLIWIPYSAVMSYSLISLPFGLPVLSYDRLSAYTKATRHIVICPFCRWEDGDLHSISQVYADMTGWKAIAELTSKAYGELATDEQDKCTIFIEANYGDAGAIHFYGREYDLPEPVTFIESYVIWAPDSIPDGPVIYIDFAPGGLNDLFKNVKEIGTVSNRYFREDGLKVFLCTDPKADVGEVYRKKALDKKQLYKQTKLESI